MSKIKISKKLKTRLKTMGNKVSNTLLKASEDVGAEDLKQNHPDYLSLKNGELTFINKKSIEKSMKSPFHNKKKRQVSKPGRVVNKLFTKDFISKNNIMETDINTFIDSWKGINSKQKGDRVVKLKGKDILRAYNFTKELYGYISSSCAHKDGTDHKYVVKESDLDFWVKNEDSVFALVVISQIAGVDKIVARKLCFTGNQLYDKSKDVPFGKKVTLHLNSYGYKQEYKQMLEDYATKKGWFNPNDVSVIIPINTRYGPYHPPADKCYVNFKYNVLATKIRLLPEKGSVQLYRAYSKPYIDTPVFDFLTKQKID